MSIFVFVSFSAVNGISFSSAFSFTAENEKCFRSASIIRHKKVLVLVLRCKVLVLVLNTRLGLGLHLEKSLDYITAYDTAGKLRMRLDVPSGIIFDSLLFKASPLRQSQQRKQRRFMSRER